MPGADESELAERFQSRLTELLRNSSRVSGLEVAPGVISRAEACAVASRADVVVLLRVDAPEAQPQLVCTEWKDEPRTPLPYIGFGLCESVGLGIFLRHDNCSELLARAASCSKWASEGRVRATRAVAFRVARLGRFCRIPDGWALESTALAADKASAISAAREKVSVRLDELDRLVWAGYFDPNR
jgi:hypothetical protein